MKSEESKKSRDQVEDLDAISRAVARELRRQIARHPYEVLGGAAALGLALGGAGATRWIAAGLAFALREGTRWAAREALRRIVEAPSPAPFSSWKPEERAARP